MVEGRSPASNRFMASMTMRSLSDGMSAMIAVMATGRSANTITSAPSTASAGDAASASGISASEASVLVLSGSRTPNTTS